MTARNRTSPAATLDTIVSALRRGETDRAAAALAEGTVEAEAMLRLAELNVRRQRWADAAWLLDHAPLELPPELAFKRNLCRNMASLAVHRPDLYRLLAATQPSDDVSIARSLTGHPTIAVRQPDGSLAGLSADNRPLAAAEIALQRLRPAICKGLAVGLASLGDGYLLYRLAHERIELLLGLQVPVFVIESDPRVVFHAMMIHDYTGREGPIEQQRFFWFVGQDWSAQFRSTVDRDPMIGAPAVTVSFTEAGAAVRTQLHQIATENNDVDNATAGSVHAYYANVSLSDVARSISEAATRRPRVLLLTTRFSTVLQYSTRDTAAAFESIGWDAKVLIEPSPAHRLYRRATLIELDRFKPDLVFQIDHLRHEHGDMFPAHLPFVCWAQDHLPALTTEGVGLQVGSTDFVLTDTADTYEQKYQYPPRQMLALPKLTRSISSRTDATDSAGPHLAFVSNASRPPRKIIDDLCDAVDDVDIQHLLRACGERMIGIYNADGSLGTYFSDILPLIGTTAGALGLTLTGTQRDHAARVLCHPLNDALYRQQALKWAAAAATRLGLQMELYGAGWESHPDLAPFARGPIAYDALSELTQRATINLQIVPYLCLHQRLLDGVMAGGFFLIRQHTADMDPGRLVAFLAACGAGSCSNVEAVRAFLPAADLPTFETLARSARPALCTTGNEDVVRMVRQWQDAGQLQPDGAPLPCFADVSFDSEASFQARLERFINEPALRRDVVAQQRSSIASRLTYEAGMKRIVRQIATRLAENAQDARLCKTVDLDREAA